MKDPIQNSSAAWYRYPMVWFVFALPAAVVVACIYTIILAHQSPPILLPSQVDVASESVIGD